MSFNKTTIYSLTGAILFILFTHSSCIVNDRTLGSGYVPEDHILKAKVDTINITIASDIPDSVSTLTATYILPNDMKYPMVVGTLRDPIYGTSEYSGAVGIIPVSDSADFGINPKLTKCFITFGVDSTFTLNDNDKSIIQSFKLYEMKRSLDSTLTYSNSLTADDYYPTPISVGSPIFMGLGNDSIKMYLTDEYAYKLLNTTQDERDDPIEFGKKIKGIYLTSETPSGNSGRINYISTVQINLQYVLNDPDREFTDKDTVTYFTYDYNYLNIIKESSDNLKSDGNTEYINIKGGIGAKPYISAAALKGHIQDWANNKGIDLSKVLIAKATIMLPYEYDQADYSRYRYYPKNLYPHTREETYSYITSSMVDSILSFRTIVYFPLDDIYYDDIVKGVINRDLSVYKADINSYLIKLLQTKDDEITSDKNLWFMPYRSATSSSTGSILYAHDYVTYYQAQLNGSLSERRPQLRIVYSMLP